MAATHDADVAFMQTALSLARRNLGQTWPNPAVGALIVDAENRVVGRGWTYPSGRPHAETVALDAAKASAKGATLYVTLEPCSHIGKTPPCVEAIIAAGIARVVVACRDLDPRVNGAGIARLKAAGIDIREGVCEKEAVAINGGFFKRVAQGKPWVAMKLATSLDGRMATASGQSHWITSEAARAAGHALRAQFDAILTGIDSVIADNPQMNCRIKGQEHRSPLRLVLDSNLRTPLESRLVQSARQTPVWVMTLSHALENETTKKSALEKAGVRLISCPEKNGKVDLAAMLEFLGGEGITRLLVEAGPRLSTAFMEQKLVDDLHWFRGNLIIGPGQEAFGHCMPQLLGDIPRFALRHARQIGNDVLEVYACSAAS